ncbi:MAG TPA: phosphoribosylpyrophosphate synthetase, partial [Halieaceae bacterium]|nr:phosphoribosylpyrophosphate synthetase [Halieaceae bacterium]
MPALLTYLDDERDAALRLASACELTALAVARHRFPDDELKLLLDVPPGTHTLVVYRSLDRPNEKLVELLLLA